MMTVMTHSAKLYRLLLLSAASVTLCLHSCSAECSTKEYWSSCSERYPNVKLFDGAYNFGWDPRKNVTEMCKQRGHVQLLKCFYDGLNRYCPERQGYVVLLTVMDYRRYERATDFVCGKNNLAVLEQHAPCLDKFYSETQSCAKLKPVTETIQVANTEIQRVLSDQSVDTLDIRTDKTKMLHFMERRIKQQLCNDRRAMIVCVERLLLGDRDTCPASVTKLVTGYYSLLAPDTCSLVGLATETEAAPPMSDQVNSASSSSGFPASSSSSQRRSDGSGDSGGGRAAAAAAGDVGYKSAGTGLSLPHQLQLLLILSMASSPVLCR